MKTLRFQNYVSATVVVAFLAGCASATNVAPLPDGQQAQSASRQLETSRYNPPLPGGPSFVRGATGPSWMSPAVKTSKVVYISSYLSNTVSIYPQSGHNQGMIGQITTAMNGPLGMYVATNGDLYVANYIDGTIPVFHKGATTPYKTLQAGTTASDLTLDSKGNAYAVEYSTSTICVIAKGSTSCTSTLTDSLDSQLYWIASDSKGDLIVDGYSHTVEEFKAGSQSATALPQTDTFPGGVAVDKSQNLLFCDGGNGSQGTISAFKPPYTGSAFYTFTVTGQPFGISLNQSEKDVWAANLPAGDGQEYSVPAGKLIDSTQGGLSENLGIALEPPGKN